MYTVNFAIKRATSTYDAQSTTPQALARVIVNAGYEVPQIPGVTSSLLRTVASAPAAATEEAEAKEQRTLRREVLIVGRTQARLGR